MNDVERQQRVVEELRRKMDQYTQKMPKGSNPYTQAYALAAQKLVRMGKR